MWTIELFGDPLASPEQHQAFHPPSSSSQIGHHHHSRRLHEQHQPEGSSLSLFESSSTTSSLIVSATIPLRTMLEESLLSTFEEGGRASRVALADFAARYFLTHHGKHQVEFVDTNQSTSNINGDGPNNVPHHNHYRPLTFRLETLDVALLKSRRQRRRLVNGGTLSYPPYVMERSDFWCCEEKLHVTVRGTRVPSSRKMSSTTTEGIDMAEIRRIQWIIACQKILSSAFPLNDPTFIDGLLHHTACVVVQHRIRTMLSSKHNAVAFIADGSILPRKSSSSNAPMDSPPAVPFKAPVDSPMSQSISVDMGSLYRYLPTSMKASTDNSTVVTLTGLVVPGGVTLICGGGYHGKSTLLQTIAVGVYDKIPGDGREYCVSVRSAVTVRAEDGRYVNNCNISAFISNLPTPPGADKALDTQHFSTRDASGSTSQAANVVEAIEMGATAMLVDEDISAANFMARDGRMRSLVMDESITPLLYRVNGLYITHKISSVVVVGGVGDWLDVPHNVILLDKYVASDATKKAQSISYQFSYGHVQYGGRGVVHRLEWDRRGMPFPRRPADTFSQKYDTNVVVSILDGGLALSLHKEEVEVEDRNGTNPTDKNGTMLIVDDDDEEDGCIDASRLEQLLGKRQLYGCGLCVAWLLQFAPKHPELGLKELLQLLDKTLDDGGMFKVMMDLNEMNNNQKRSTFNTMAWGNLLESVGFAERPRMFEIGHAITRLHGIQMEEIPVEPDEEDIAVRLEEERKKRALAELWAKRRAPSTT